jgi:exopolysaccharide biosynthesis polyprenyl glycosylphosphotransferase
VAADLPAESKARIRTMTSAPARRAARTGWRAALPVVASDAIAVAFAFWIAYWFRFNVFPHYIPGVEPPDPRRYVEAAPVLVLVVLGVFLFMNAYNIQRGTQAIDEMFAALRALAVAVVVVFAMIGLYRDGAFTYSRLTFVYWAIAGSVLILLGRYGVRLLRARQWKRGTGVDRVLVVGSGAAADLVLQRIRMFPDYGYKVVGVVTDSLNKGESLSGSDVLGGRSELQRLVGEKDVHVVFVAEPELTPDEILGLADSCRDCGAEFRIVPSLLEIMTTRATADQLDGIPLLQFRHGLDVDAAKATSKRVTDVLIAGLGMVIISPLLALTVLLIKATSPGPALIHQERAGLDERPMQMHKFRTMSANAEAETGPVWASADDPRRTAVGKFLRRFSIDELPQLWNVLVGEMSLVGPRPERPQFVREFKERVPRYADRHLVRPGLTGWAQVNDLRGHTSVEERLIYDLYYIENWSLPFDLKIILITLFRIFTHKNAY